MRVLCLAACVFGLAGMAASGNASTSHYLVREHIVLDLRSGLEWPLLGGQIYNQGMCEGEVLQFTYSDIPEVIKQANKELGALASAKQG